MNKKEIKLMKVSYAELQYKLIECNIDRIRLQQENNQLKEQCEKQRYAITENCDLRLEIEQLKEQRQELRNWLIEQEERSWDEVSSTFGDVLDKLNELEGGKNE